MRKDETTGRFIAGHGGGPGRPKPNGTEWMNKSEKRRDYKMRSIFGITLAEYNQLFKKQDGLCAICGRPETKVLNGVVTNLCVDHDHETGAVRGLLCYRCNTGIGKLCDSPILLRKAAEYIEKMS